ncbi:MAG: hypothetical protein KC421_09155, partial [Anaerolineales bacterium]|nr:hypothetical protein [Anaerolineales bacterium]
PNSAERASMRHSLLSSVLEIAADNGRFQDRIAIFEVGPIFLVDEDEVLPQENTQLSVVMTGRRGVPAWGDDTIDTYDFFDLKGVLEGLFNELHLDIAYEAAEHPTFRPGRTARLLINDRQIGVIGELHPLVVEQLDMRVERDQPVLAADISLDVLIPHIPPYYPFEPISPFPAVREDVAVVVDKGVTAVTVADIIKLSGGNLLKHVELFDVYEGNQLGAGKKSLAYHLTFQAKDKTLNDKVVRKQRNNIVAQLKKRLGATIRE